MVNVHADQNFYKRLILQSSGSIYIFTNSMIPQAYKMQKE